jgi:hypothetical protein
MYSKLWAGIIATFGTRRRYGIAVIVIAFGRRHVRRRRYGRFQSTYTVVAVHRLFYCSNRVIAGHCLVVNRGGCFQLCLECIDRQEFVHVVAIERQGGVVSVLASVSIM